MKSEATNGKRPHRAFLGGWLLGRPLTLTDARGRRVLLYVAPLSWRRDVEPEGVSRETWLKARDLQMGGGWLAPLITIPAVVLPTVIVFTAGVSQVLISLFVGFMCVLAVAWMYFRTPFKFVRRLCGGLLQRGICGSCGGDLSGGTSEPDGCTVCPNCGAAWDLALADRLPVAFGSGSESIPVSTVDDRKQLVAIFSPRVLATDGQRRQHLSKREFEAIRRESHRGSKGYDYPLKIALLITALSLFQFIIGFMTKGIAALASLPFLLVLMSGAIALWAYRSLGANPRAVVGVMRSRGLCSSCAYTLTGIPAQEDGCTVCPECGAAWRLGQEHPTAEA